MSGVTGVFTQYTLNTLQCATNNQFTVDTCSPLCDTNTYAEIKYDFKNDNYVMTTYSDDTCTSPEKVQPTPSSFNCEDTKVGEYDVTCSNTVFLTDFKSFQIAGAGGKSPCASTEKVQVDLNQCTSICNQNVKVVTDGDNVNGYTVGVFNENSCTTVTNAYNIMCLSKNQTVSSGDYNVICYSSSSSTDSSSSSNDTPTDSSNGSTLVYSMLLLASAALFNLII